MYIHNKFSESVYMLCLYYCVTKKYPHLVCRTGTQYMGKVYKKVNKII